METRSARDATASEPAGGAPPQGPWDRLQAWSQQHPWAAACLFTLLASGLFFLTLDPAFQVPDDAYLMFMLDGYFYGAPDYHTIYLSTLTTRLLATLYAWAPGVSWFGLSVYGLHLSAVLVWTYLFLRRPRRPFEFVLFLFAFSALTLPMLLELTYSSAALVAGAIGIYLHFERSGEPGGLGAALLGGTLVALCFLTRDEVFPALLLPAVPMLAFRARRVPLRRHTAALGVFLALVLAGQWSDSIAYASPEWRAYQRRFELCFALHATPRLEPSPQLDQLAQEAGWSPNDLALFTNFIYADPEVYNEPSLSTIVEGTAGIRWARQPWRAARDRIIGDHSVELLIILLNLAIFVPRMGRHDRWIACMLVLAFSAGALYLASFQRFPTRLALPITWMVVAWLVFARHSPGPTLGWIRKPRVRAAVGRSVGGLLIAVSLVELVLESRENLEEREAILEPLRSMEQLGEDVLVIALAEIPFEDLSPLTPGHDLPHFDYVGVGWRQHSPPYNAHLAKLGIENVYLAPLEKENVYLSVRKQVYPMYQEFVREHYGREAKLEPVLAIDDKTFLYGRPR